MKTHPLWKLYGQGERGRILEETIQSLAERFAGRAEQQAGPQVLEQAGVLFQKLETAFSGELRPRRLWWAFTLFGLGGGGGMGARRPRQVTINFNPGSLLLLEYPEAKEGDAGKALEALQEALLQGKGGAWKFQAREIAFHGRKFQAFRLQVGRRSGEVIFAGRFGRFLAVSFLNPWPLFEAENVSRGAAPSLAEKPWAHVLEGAPSDRAVLVLDPGLIPWQFLPEPLPLAGTELGLPPVQWLQLEWDPATGKTDLLARTKKPVGGYLASLARSLDPDEFARFLPADTAAFAVIPFDWPGLAAPLKPLLEEASRQGLIPSGLPMEKLVTGFAGDSLAVSPMPVLSGARGIGFALRFNRGIPVPDVMMAVRMTPEFLERARAFVEDQVKRRPSVKAYTIKGLRVYRGPWLGGITFLFKDNWAFVFPKPGMARGFLPALAGKKPSLAAGDQYQAFRKSIPSRPTLAFYYVDGPGLLRTGENTARFFLALANIVLRVPGLEGLLHTEDELSGAGLHGYGSGLFLEKTGVAWRS
ncbi:MAG TPA: hypothetical protein ENJ97_02790, partial [Planctomycetes bacterium]|nr:hypothetical protein [Planctomycetota bacterium]